MCAVVAVAELQHFRDSLQHFCDVRYLVLRPNFPLGSQTVLSSFRASFVRTEFGLASIASGDTELLIAPSSISTKVLAGECNIPTGAYVAASVIRTYDTLDLRSHPVKVSR